MSGVVEEHDVRPSELGAEEEALSREEQRLARYVAASNARAKTVEEEPRKEAAAAPTAEEQATLKCVVCRKVGGGPFCLVETKRNPKAPVHCDCFRCYECGNELAGTSYGEDARGHLMCALCMQDAAPAGGAMHGPVGEAAADLCAKCGSPITGNQAKVRAMGNTYHEDCFACDACGSRIHTTCYKGDGGKLYCSEPCARRGAEEAAAAAAPAAPAAAPAAAPEGSKKDDKAEEEAPAAQPEYKFCTACGKPLEGRYVVVGGQPMHADCFVCGICGEKLGTQVYNVGGKMCCQACAEKSQ